MEQNRTIGIWVVEHRIDSVLTECKSNRISSFENVVKAPNDERAIDREAHIPGTYA